MYRVEQHGGAGPGQSGSEEEPNDDDISYHQFLDTSSDFDEEDNDVQAYEEDSVAAQHVNQVNLVYQDEYEEEVADWEWSPRNTMCVFVHMTLEQAASYWHHEL